MLAAPQSTRSTQMGMLRKRPEEPVVPRDNQDESPCCLIQECSPGCRALPHPNAPDASCSLFG